jgi:hypothetical protein
MRSSLCALSSMLPTCIVCAFVRVVECGYSVGVDVSGPHS